MRSNWFFKKGVSKGRLQFLFVCGILMTLGASIVLQGDFELLAGRLITPPWYSFVLAPLLIIYGLVYTVMAWQQLRRLK